MYKSCTILGAGPNLNDHFNKYYDYINKSFTIVTSPLILSNLKIDLQFYECADKEKFEGSDDVDKKYYMMLSTYFNKIDALN